MMYATAAANLTAEDYEIHTAIAHRLMMAGVNVRQMMATFDQIEAEHTLRQAKIQNSDPGGLDWRGMIRFEIRAAC